MASPALPNAALPNAPQPTTVSSSTFGQQTSTPSSSSSQTPAASQSPAPSDEKQAKTDADRAEEQVKKQEKQRLLGVYPNFNVAYDRDVPPLTPKQKLHVAFHTTTDPVFIAIAAIDAGYSQATDDFGPEFDTSTNAAGMKVVKRYEGYGQGWLGYGKRLGASYADNFDGTMLGNAILPILLHEDPRYFRLGDGTPASRRILYAIGSTFWCKRDNGKWGPNYANVLGNLAAGGIANIYYPEHDRGAGLTFTRGITVTLYGTAGGLANEFLPDITRHFLHREVNGKRIRNADGTTSPATAPQPQAPSPASP